MLKISDFFKRIQNTYTQELFIRSVIIAAIKKYAHFDVSTESIHFKSSTVILKGVTATQKSQIFIKKKQILDEIHSVEMKKHITDIA